MYHNIVLERAKILNRILFKILPRLLKDLTRSCIRSCKILQGAIRSLNNLWDLNIQGLI